MSWTKRFLRSDRVRRIFCAIIAAHIKLVQLTSRRQIDLGDHVKPMVESGNPFIVALWHSRVSMSPFAWPFEKRVTVLTSDHRDGRLVAYTLKWFRFNAIFGSTNKVEMRSLREIMRLLKSGGIFGITPDGPRGPRMRVKPGVISIAKMSGCPIIPMTYSLTRQKPLNTWDRMAIPLPFSTMYVVWGTPIHVAKSASAEEMENARQQLEAQMITLTAEVDSRAGHIPVPPGDPITPDTPVKAE